MYYTVYKNGYLTKYKKDYLKNNKNRLLGILKKDK